MLCEGLAFSQPAPFAKIAQKSHATCDMVSRYGTNDVKVRIPPKFCRAQFCSLELICKTCKNYAPQKCGIISAVLVLLVFKQKTRSIQGCSTTISTANALSVALLYPSIVNSILEIHVLNICKHLCLRLRYECRQNFAERNFAVWSSSAKHAKIMLLKNVVSLVRY